MTKVKRKNWDLSTDVCKMREIRVGLNVQSPTGRQKAHTIVEDFKTNPPNGINYSWAFPKQLNNQRIYCHLKNNDFDLLESFDSLLITPNKWIAVLATISYALNFEINNNYYERQKRTNIIEKILRKENLKKIIFFSKEQAKTIQAYAKITDPKILNKVEVVYNAVKIPENLQNKKNKDRFRILFIGADFYRKGGEALIEAFKSLKQKYPQIELEIHSSLKKEDYANDSLYSPINHSNICQIVDTDDSIFNYNSFEYSREQILSTVFPRADLFILPSFNEGVPYVLQEAMAYGLPVITTGCTPSIPEIIENEKNGYIIDINERIETEIKQNEQGKRIIPKEINNYLAQEIINKISQMIDNDSLRKEMIRNNIKKARTLFSFEKRNKIMKRVYEEAVQ